jgi:hypothetical protein
MMPSSLANDVAAEIWHSPQFQADLMELTRSFVANSIGMTPEVLDDAAVRRLVKSAPTLAIADRIDFAKVSYQIAASAQVLFSDRYDGLSSLLALVLGRRGNFPAIDLMLPDAETHLPPLLRLEGIERRQLNTINISGSAHSLTDFQRMVWSDLQARKSVAVSAPTSAGKSFLFRSYVEEFLGTRAGRIVVLIVPTRALINQMQDYLRPRIEALGGHVISVPRVHEDQLAPMCYVLTQERLVVLLDESSEFVADLIVVDEAQSIDEDGRGIILQSVVDELLARRPGTQVLFTLPIASNVESLGHLFDVGPFTERSTEESPVGQTVVLLKVDPIKLDRVHVSVRRSASDTMHVGEVRMSTRLKDSVHRIAHLAHEFGRHAPSIVYADAQGQCETIAGILTELAGDELSSSPELEELSRFIKDHVHPKYSLADTVQKGVGFHYGYIPSLVRKEIERAFDIGSLRFIVCTTTLLKGVNLPARNIFMTRPKVGKKIWGLSTFGIWLAEQGD